MIDGYDVVDALDDWLTARNQFSIFAVSGDCVMREDARARLDDARATLVKALEGDGKQT